MLVPRAPLIVFGLVPVALSALYLLEPQLLEALLLVDAAVVLLALADGLWALRAPGVSAHVSAPEVFSLGQPNTVECVLSSRARRRLSLLVSQDLFDGASSSDLPVRLDVPARGHASARWRVVPRERGAHQLGRVFVRYPTPLGLFYRQVALGAPQPVRVYPDLASLRTYDLLARQDREHGLFRTMRRQGGESEFERLREYSPDDPYRSIDWRATARSQKPIVRQYQLESNQSLMFVLDAGRLMTATSDGVSLFDHALNATLLLAQVAVRKGDRVGLLSFDDAVRAFVSPGSGHPAQRRLIRASYALYPRLVESDYDGAFRTLATRVRKRTLAVLFTQVAEEAVAQSVLTRVRRMLPAHLPLVVLLRDTEIEDLATAPSRANADLYARAAAAEELRRREAFARALGSAGVHVLDVRPAALTPALVNRYLEIKARNQL